MISKEVCVKCYRTMFRILNWEQDDTLKFEKIWFCPYHKGPVEEKDEVPVECEFSLEHLVHREV
jgi:hypothetical protein